MMEFSFLQPPGKVVQIFGNFSFSNDPSVLYLSDNSFMDTRQHLEPFSGILLVEGDDEKMDDLFDYPDMERDPNMLYTVENMSGNVEVFNELLRKRLAESGWCDQVKLMCIESIKTQLKNGQTPKMEDLIGDVSIKARTMVPTAVKKELLMEMKEHLLQKFGYYDTKLSRD